MLLPTDPAAAARDAGQQRQQRQHFVQSLWHGPTQDGLLEVRRDNEEKKASF